ncbi:MAG: hypothetical protein U1F43_04930 [Myxococcota bacterium]
MLGALMASSPPPEDHVEVGALTVFFPTGSMRSFWFMHDLAGLFGDEVNADAERRLRLALSERPKGRLGLDVEADSVLVSASNAALMQRVLEAVRALCRDPEDLPTAALAAAQRAMEAAPKPKRQRWQIGSVFAVPLADGAWAFGQVVDLARPAPRRHAGPLRAPARAEPALAPDEVLDVVTARTLTILHTTASGLDADGVFRVVGEGPIALDPGSGPHGPRAAGRSWDGIATVANAWYGLYPWNLLYAPVGLDRSIMPRSRPLPRAWMLDAPTLERLRSGDPRGLELAKLIAERARDGRSDA